jgi:hypothetical protein
VCIGIGIDLGGSKIDGIAVGEAGEVSRVSAAKRSLGRVHAQVRRAYDANCFALSEAIDGAGPRRARGVRRDPRHR